MEQRGGRSRWVTGAGAGLTAFGIGFSLIDPADFLGWFVLIGAAALTVGIGRGI